MTTERARWRSSRRLLTSVLLVVAVLVVGASVQVIRQNREALEAHEREESLARQDLRDFIKEQHVATRKDIALFRRRIRQLEDFILKQGLEVPKNGTGLYASPKGSPPAPTDGTGPSPTPPSGPSPTSGPSPGGPLPASPTPVPSPSEVCFDPPPPIPGPICLPP